MTAHEAPENDARVGDAELARLRARIGERVTIAEPPFLTEATRDAIRHWVHATGDRNPLFLDEAHATRSRHGGLIAPPCILYAFDRQSIGYRGGLPGVHAIFAGSSWRWHRPIRLGERIRAEVTFTDLVELSSRFAGRMFKQVSSIRYVTVEGEPVADAECWGMRTERTAAREKDKYGTLGFETYTPERLAEIAALYAAERPRGAEPLWWDDVAVGDAVPGIVRGPYTATTAVAFEQAWGGLFIRAHGYWFEFLARHPAAGMANAYGIPEPPEAVHWDGALARRVGVPEAYDYGPERISWLATMLTNWIGDDGDLVELHCEVRRFNMVGDLTFCAGRVTAKGTDAAGRDWVRLDVEARDQRGEVTASGRATVALPRRAEAAP